MTIETYRLAEPTDIQIEPGEINPRKLVAEIYRLKVAYEDLIIELKKEHAAEMQKVFVDLADTAGELDDAQAKIRYLESDLESLQKHVKFLEGPDEDDLMARERGF